MNLLPPPIELPADRPQWSVRTEPTMKHNLMVEPGLCEECERLIHVEPPPTGMISARDVYASHLAAQDAAIAAAAREVWPNPVNGITGTLEKKMSVAVDMHKFAAALRRIVEAGT